MIVVVIVVSDDEMKGGIRVMVRKKRKEIRKLLKFIIFHKIYLISYN